MKKASERDRTVVDPADQMIYFSMEKLMTDISLCVIKNEADRLRTESIKIHWSQINMQTRCSLMKHTKGRVGLFLDLCPNMSSAKSCNILTAPLCVWLHKNVSRNSEPCPLAVENKPTESCL